MDSSRHTPCPVELHHAVASTGALLLLYRHREECALLHGCTRETCPIGQEWPGRWRAAADAAGWRLFGFIALAFAGPRDPL